MTVFRKYIASFLLLHLLFGILFLTGYKIFTDLTEEIFSYLVWFLVLFAFVTTVIQSLIFTVLSSRIQLNKFAFFIIALLVELLLANILVAYGGGQKNLTWNLITRNSNDLVSSLIIHVSIFFPTLILSVSAGSSRQRLA
jgi:hypothetical protein